MINKKIRLALLIPELSGGGICTTLLNLYRNLDCEKYEAVVAVYDRKTSFLAVPDMKTVYFNLPHSPGLAKRIIRTLKVYFRIKGFKRSFKPDITLSFKDNANLINLFTRHNDKILMSVHTTPSADYRGIHGRLYKYLIRYFFRKADSVIAVSEGIKNDMIRNYGLKPDLIQTVYNSVDLARISSLSEQNIEPELDNLFSINKTIISVGRLTRAKGQWHLIRAFKEVLKDLPDSKLIIIGEGEMRPYLENLISGLELGKSVFLIGSRNNPYKYMRRSAIFVLSSIYEGFGIVIVEAMACGLPVISTDCRSGPGEIIRDKKGNEYGILVNTPDGICYNSDSSATKEELNLAEKMHILITDSGLAEKYKNLSMKRHRDFSTKTIMPQWNKIFQKMVE